MTRPLVVIGDSLLDVDLIGRVDRLAPDAPVPVLHDAQPRTRPGGAALCATIAARNGDRPVVLVTPLVADADGERLLAALPEGLRVVALPAVGATPVKTRLRTADHAIARLDRGGVQPVDAFPEPVRAELAELLRTAAGVLVADYGNGTAAHPEVRAALEQAAAAVPVVWDPHPRGPAPVARVTLVTPNLSEARAATGPAEGAGLREVTRAAGELRERWSARTVAVTMGAAGALLDLGTGLPLMVPAAPAAAGDTCGAGDCFAVTAALALANGSLPTEAVTRAVGAAADFVAAGGAGAWASSPTPDAGPDVSAAQPDSEETEAVAARLRRRGRTLVATGGCFDLLHAGHVATLQAARRMGDALVVCLNSDSSVRRLKGPGRPLQRDLDRARILRALSCVDAVVLFDEDTPIDVLDRLRPDVWVKGGDYSAETLPEAPLLASWGGQVVAVPYLPERSTTRLVSAAVTNAADATGGQVTMTTILVLRALGLGDFLTALPALRLVRRARPGAEIVLAAPARFGELARRAGLVDTVLDYDGLHHLGPLPSPPLRAEIAIDLHGNGPASRDVLLATEPGELIAYSAQPDAAAWRGTCLPWQAAEHEVDRWRRLVAVGLDADEALAGGVAGSLALPPLPAQLPDGALVLHPGASAPSRQWPVDRFVAVARGLRRLRRPIVVTGSPPERELVEAVADGAGATPLSSLELDHLLALVGRASLVVSGDTGVAHVASTYAVPSVVLFGPVSPSRWGPPPAAIHRALHLPEPADPPGDPHGGHPDPALLRISAEFVLQACDEVRRAAERRAAA